MDRSETEDVYRNQDGSTTVYTSALPINVGTGGEFEPIDTTLVEASSSDVSVAAVQSPVDQEPAVKAELLR